MCWSLTFRCKKESFSQDLQRELAAHSDDEGVVGDLEDGLLHDPVVGPLEHHRDGRQGRDQDHQPLEVGDQPQELVDRLEPDLPFFPCHRILETSVIPGTDDGLADSSAKRLALQQHCWIDLCFVREALS